MKLDFLDDVTDGGRFPWADPDKLLRLYDFSFLELTKIKQAIKENLIDGQGELVIAELDFVCPINCALTFQLSEQDFGIKCPPNDENIYVGLFSKTTYTNMLTIIDSVMRDDETVNGFNWLYDPAIDEIDLLLSSGAGSW